MSQRHLYQHLVGMDRGLNKVMARECARKDERKENARATTGKEKVEGGLDHPADTVDSAGNGATRRLNVSNGGEDDRWNLVQQSQTC